MFCLRELVLVRGFFKEVSASDFLSVLHTLDLVQKIPKLKLMSLRYLPYYFFQ